MSFKRVSVLATFLAATVSLASTAAHATVATQTENITLSGTFGSGNGPLPGGPPNSGPFTPGPFTLDFVAPLTSFAQGFQLSDVYSISSPIGGPAGTYTAGGQSSSFSNDGLVVIGTDPTMFQIGGNIGSYQTSVTFSGAAATDLFTASSSANGVTYTLTPGTYHLTATSAYFNNDPGFSGGVLTISNPSSSVPEPPTLALFALPLVLLALTRRRKYGSLT